MNFNKKINVLLVDDERLNLDLLNLLVSRILPNAKISPFISSTEAMNYIKDNKVDIAFLDINMRVIDGMKMSKRILELYPNCNVIFCTGYKEYALDAWKVNASGYLLKPVSEEKIRKALENLRNEVPDSNRVSFKCFGNFEVYCDGIPVKFKYNKTKEFIAYLVDRNGVKCKMREIGAAIFPDEGSRSYLYQIRLDFINTFRKLGVEDIILQSKGLIGIDKSKVQCDYYDYLESGTEPMVKEYMSQYSFAEITYASIFLK